MADYICIDGPLEGRRFRWRRAPRTGEPVTVALLDVDHGVLMVDYRLQRTPGASTGGRLEFVAARDAHLERRRFRPLQDARTHLGRLRRPLGWVHA